MNSEPLERSYQICSTLLDNLSFLPSLHIRKISVPQMTAMFENIVDLANRFNRDNKNNPKAGTYSSKLFTKSIYLIDDNRDYLEDMRSSLIVEQLQNLVGIQVNFIETEEPKLKTDEQFEQELAQ